MNSENEVKISPNDIKKGDFIRFRVEPWFAKKEGLVRIFKDENDGIDQGFVSAVTDKSVHVPFCEIHERRDKWIPRRVFVYVYVIKDKIRKDWIKESEELYDDS